MNLILRSKNMLHSVVLFLFLFSCLTANSQTMTPKYNVQMIDNVHGFYEYLPQGYGNDNSTYPVLIFCHGIGELGYGNNSQLPLVLANGTPKLIAAGSFPTSFTVNGQTYKFIMLFPQFISWPTPDDIGGVIDYAIKNYHVNVNKIYLTGLSMGGGPVWDYAGLSLATANRLAAIVPVCGVSEPIDDRISVLTNSHLPIWALHNLGDDAVPVSNTIGYIDKITALTLLLYPLQALNPIAKKTIFPVNGHDAWSTAYDPNYRENNMNVYEWMLSFQRNNGGSTAPINQSPTSNAGPDQTITLPTSSVTLNGSGSDPDGTIKTYAWTQTAGPSTGSFNNSSAPNPTINNLIAGTYTFRLTVTDNSGATAYDEINVVVNSQQSVAAPPAGTVAIPGKIEAENFTNQFGVINEKTTDDGGGLDVGWIEQGDWFEYSVNVATAGNYTVNFRVASPYGGDQLQLKTSDGTVLTTVSIPQTFGFQIWKTVSATVALKAGAQTLRVYASQNSWWNINWLEFVASSAVALPGYQAIPGKIEAETYSGFYGVINEFTNDDGGGSDVGWIQNGNWMEYNVNVTASGNYQANFRVASPFTGQQLTVKSSSGTVLATVNIPFTGSFQIWKTVGFSLYLPAGSQTIRVTSIQNGWWNLNWMQFVAGSSASPDQTTESSSSSGTLNLGETSLIKEGFSIYPNPVNKVFAMQLNNKYTGAMNVQVVNLAGVIVKQYKLSKDLQVSQLSLSVAELPTGTYFVKVQIGTWTDTKKLIKL